MASSNVAVIKSRTKNLIIRLKNEKKMTENEIIEYALMKAFKK